MLTTDDVLGLAPFSEADSEQYLEWVNQEEFARLLGRSLPVTKEEHLNWYRALTQNPQSVVFSVKMLADGSYLGNVWLHNIHWVNRNAELRVFLGADHAQDKGYGTRACRLLRDFGFQKLGLHKIYLYVSTSNPRARAAFEKVGFIEEGRLRQEFYLQGEFVDVLRMAVLRS